MAEQGMADHTGERAMIRLLDSRWISLLVRIVLGLVFVYSSWAKIADPPGFAEMVWNYRILPGYLINPVAIVLPWLELLAGLALISGFLRKGAALLIGVVLMVFIVALSTDLLRGIAIECGCFPTASEAKTAVELFAGMKLDLLRDAGLLFLSILVLFSRPTAAKL
jgi:putative oxidoreductase